jgi:hypothetical protein
MEYYSFGKGTGYDNSNLSPVGGDAVVHFLNVGHDISGDYARNIGESAGYDYFNNYPAQGFLQLAKERIERKYPELIVEIIDQWGMY